jgi:predicted nucleotidyltransferase
MVAKISNLDDLKSKLAPFCRQHSVARGEADAESDLDLLITFQPGVQPGLEFYLLPDEIERIVGRKVDLLTRRSVERDGNYIRRRGILDSALEIYAG